MEFLTREFFDLLIFAVIGIGLVLAGFRLYQDFTRPLPRRRNRSTASDTQEHRAVKPSKAERDNR